MWAHQYFQAVNQFRAVNVTDGRHLYQDPFPSHESFFSASLLASFLSSPRP